MVCGAILAASPACVRAAVPAAAPWLFVSDIHLDPTGTYADGGFGSDTNPRLLDEAIAAMRRAVPNPPVVVLGGDFFAHRFDASRAQATLVALAARFDRAFPHAQFVLVLGNEDSECGDYRAPMVTPFLEAVARAWEPLVDRNGAAPTFARTFAHDASYTALLPGTHRRAVVLDDVFWSIRYGAGCGATDGASEAAFGRLDALLPTEGIDRPWVFAHIPPGIDAYSSARLAHRLITVPFLRPAENDRFVSMLADPRRRVALVVAGHAHRFAFRVAADGANAVPVVQMPAISPIYLNAPSFLTGRVDDDGAIASLTEWSQTDTGWRALGDTQALGLARVDVASIRALEARLTAGGPIRETFQKLYTGGGLPEIDDRMRALYVCAAVNVRIDAFRSCIGDGGIGYLTARGLACLAAAIVAFAVLACAIVVAVRRRRRRGGATGLRR